MPSALAAWRWVKKEWFLVGIVVAVLLAAAAPGIARKGGPLAPEITVKYVLVPIIFLVSGYGLPSSKVLESIRFVRVHAFVQVYNLAVIPAVVVLVRLVLLQTKFSLLLADGLLVMACVPTTVSSCVVLTRSANGEEALALFNAVFGNVAGIFITPALLLWLLRVKTEAPILSIFVSLVATVLLPFLVGQALRFAVHYRFPAWRSWKPPKINNVILLLIIWSAFSSTFAEKVDLPIGDLLLTLFLVIVLFLLFSLAIWKTSAVPQLRFTIAERVAILFTASQKTVAFGIPLINVVYGDQAGILSLPLLLYHPLQLFVGGAIAPRLARMVEHEASTSTGISSSTADVEHGGTARVSTDVAYDALPSSASVITLPSQVVMPEGDLPPSVLSSEPAIAPARDDVALEHVRDDVATAGQEMDEDKHVCVDEDDDEEELDREQVPEQEQAEDVPVLGQHEPDAEERRDPAHEDGNGGDDDDGDGDSDDVGGDDGGDSAA